MYRTGIAVIVLTIAAACVDGSSALSGRDGGVHGVDAQRDAGTDAGRRDGADAGPPPCPPVTTDTDVDFELIPSRSTRVELRVDGQPVVRSPFRVRLEPVDPPELLPFDLDVHNAGERFIAPGLWDVRASSSECLAAPSPCGVYVERRRIDGGRLDIDIPSRELTVRVELPAGIDIPDQGPWIRLGVDPIDPARSPGDLLWSTELPRTNPAEMTLGVVPGRYAIVLLGGDGPGLADAAATLATVEVESDRAVTVRARPYTVAGTLSFASSEIFERLQPSLDVVVLDDDGGVLARDSVNERGEYALSLYPGRYQLGTALVDSTSDRIERHLSDGPLVELGDENRRVDFNVEVDEYAVSLSGVGPVNSEARLTLWRGRRRFARIPPAGDSLLLSPGIYRATWSGFCAPGAFICAFEVDPALAVAGGGPMSVDIERRDVDVSLQMPPDVPDAVGFLQLANLDVEGNAGGPVSSAGRAGPFPVPPRRFQLFFSSESEAFRPRIWIPLGVIDTARTQSFEREVPAPIRYRGRLRVDGTPVTNVSDSASVGVRLHPDTGFTDAPLSDGEFDLRVAPGDLELRYLPSGGCIGRACAPQRLPRCTP